MRRSTTNKRLAAVLTASIGGGALPVGATPAAAAPLRAVDPCPATTTPDGKSLRLTEFIGTYYAILEPALAGDSAWTEAYGSSGTPSRSVRRPPPPPSRNSPRPPGLLLGHVPGLRLRCGHCDLHRLEPRGLIA